MQLEELAREVGLKRSSAIIEEVRNAVDRFPELSAEVGLPKKVQDRVAKALGLATPRAAKKRPKAAARRSKKRSR